MEDAGKALSGGKHGALWERMKSKQRPQTIHRTKGLPTGSSKKIPMSITMSPETSQEEASELIGIQFDDSVTNLVDNDPSTWAMMDYGEGKENQLVDNKDRREPRDMLSFLGTSFISASTQDDAVVKENSLGSPMREPVIAGTTRGLTPGVCWKNWQQEEVQEGDLSLLQHSMISDESASSLANLENQTILSEVSLEKSLAQTPYPMTPGTELGLTASPSSPLTAMRLNSMHQALEERSVYICRIQELEEALKSAQANATQDSMERHLDHAGKSHHTPARSLSTQGHAAPSALLERNKTLVKEVRFAEQTCVELSQRNAALEKEVERLESHLQETRHENESLHDEIVQSSRECATLVAQNDALEVALLEERERRAVDIECAQMQITDYQTQLLELQQQLAGDGNRVTNRSPEKSHRSSSSSSHSPTSQVLAKTLQTQLERGYSDGDKILALEGKLAESQESLSKALQELESFKAEAKKKVTEADRSTQMESEISTCSMSSELELARAQAKLASLSKEMQILRVAESSSRHALSQAKLQLSIVQRERDELIPNVESARNDDVHRQEMNELRITIQKLTQECYEQERAALQASNKVNNLEQELLLSRKQVSLQSERLQEEFFEMTQAALANIEKQSRRIDQKVKSRTEQFALRLNSMAGAVQILQNSLDFQSESSHCADEEDIILSASASTKNPDQEASEEFSADGTVLNATFYHSQSATRSIHEEMLLEQMEEARPTNRSTDSLGHEHIQELSFIEGMSHLYDDLSALLTHDPTSPEQKTEAGFQKGEHDIKCDANTSVAERSSVQGSLGSVEQDCLKLRTILERAQKVTSKDNGVLLDIIEDQKNIIQSLEFKLSGFASEASKIEFERRNLNAAVLEMSKAYNRCQSDLRETSSALKASQEAEVEAKAEVQGSLQKLLQKLQEKEKSIASLRNENNKAVRKYEEEKLRVTEVETALAELQLEYERMGNALQGKTLRIADVSSKVKSLQQLQKEQERKVNGLEESLLRSETALDLLEAEKSELEKKYNEASLDLRALSSEREQATGQLIAAKRHEEELRREVALGSKTISMQNEQLDRMKAEREEATKKSQELSKAVDELTTSRLELLAEVEQLQSALSMMDGELDHLKISYITCNDKLAGASERNASKDEILAKFRAANFAAKEMVANVEEMLAQTKSELEVSEQERAALEERVIGMERELQESTEGFATYKQSMEEKLAERHDLIGVIQSTAEALKSTFEHKLASVTQEHEARIAEVDQAVSDFASNFIAAYSDSQETLMQLGIMVDTADSELSEDDRGTLTWSHSLKVASDQIPRWQHIVSVCCEAMGDDHQQLLAALGKVEELRNEMSRRRSSETKLEAELRDQYDRSESLANELQSAEAEIAESRREINETSKALGDTKKELSQLFHYLRDQQNSTEDTEELMRERDNAESRAADLAKTIVALNNKLDETSKAAGYLKRQIQEKDEATRQLESKNSSLDRKCERLREYIRRLTSKCEEWAECYDTQSTVLKRLHGDRRHSRKEAVGRRQEEVARDTEQHAPKAESEENHQWSAERTMLHRVHHLVGEDMDDIASELNHFGLK